LEVTRRPLWRLPLIACGFLGLFFGVGAGLARLGYAMPVPVASLAAVHGPLMIGAFLGVVISLERAVAIGRAWAYLGPLLAALGSIALIAGEAAAGAWMLAGASGMLLLASLDIFRRQRADFTAALAAGAACWTVGNVVWATGTPAYAVVPWWLAFLVVTIAAERLELTRFLPPSPWARRVFALIVAVIAIGLVAASARIFAAGLLALAAWLVKQDIARRTVRTRGLTRFIAVCLLSGYAWLVVAASVTLAAGTLAPGTALYDAALHALTLGFVFSMIFGHAPVIFPAVLGVRMAYHAAFYVPLLLLHASLVARVGGDLYGSFAWTRAGALVNAVALAAFLVNTAVAIVRGRRAPRDSRST
jgi:hypothetical protein